MPLLPATLSMRVVPDRAAPETASLRRAWDGSWISGLPSAAIGETRRMYIGGGVIVLILIILLVLFLVRR